MSYSNGDTRVLVHKSVFLEAPLFQKGGGGYFWETPKGRMWVMMDSDKGPHKACLCQFSCFCPILHTSSGNLQLAPPLLMIDRVTLDLATGQISADSYP